MAMSLSLSRELLSIRSKSPAYQYARLDSERKEVRLLRILKSDPITLPSRRSSISKYASRVRCQVISVPLEESPAFTALSYAWGSSKQKKEIELNGFSMYISGNLQDALLQFQADDNPSQEYFWIDAICINQLDTAEKNEQVQLMGEIYGKANTVIAWLGKEDLDCTFAMESIQGIHDTQIFTQKGIRSAIAAVEISKEGNNEEEKSFLQVKTALDHLLDPFDFDSVVKAVGVLISRSWWRRLWVIQELVLSRQAYIRCGPLAITWDSFEFFLDVCDLFMLCYSTHSTYDPAYIIAYKAFILSKCWRQVKSGQKPTMFQLFEMMITMAIRETSDPRDRVYALLGLAGDREQLVIRPDYSLTCAQVYMRTAEVLIKNHGLIMLSYCNFKPSSKLRIEGLPSWSPDLSGTVPDPLRGNATTSIYRASDSSDATISFRSYGSVRLLKLQSVLVSRVAIKSNERPTPNASFDPSKARVLQKWLRKLSWFTSDVQGLDDALWRVLIANRISKRGQETSRDAQPQDQAGFEALMSRDKAYLTSSDENVKNYLYSAWLRTVGRCIFTTSSGHIGLASSETRVGDHIVIILGADVPFVVRDGENDHCQVIGEAYVHGVMQGEAMQESPRIGPLYIR